MGMTTSAVTWTISTGAASGLHIADHSTYVYNGDPRQQSPNMALQSSWTPYEPGAHFGEPLPPMRVDPQIIAKPDHAFNPLLDMDGRPYYDTLPPYGSNLLKGRRLFCQDCPAGNIHMDDPGAHPYVIHEWELG